MIYCKELLEKKHVLVAAHRGMFGADIPCNSIPAFELALKSGADILEMDLFKSTDGEVFVFHNGTEPFFLDRHTDIMRMSSEEIRSLKLVNCDKRDTRYGISSFDEILEIFKGRCLINMDRAFKTGCFVEAAERVKAHNMQDQILVKSDPILENLKLVEEYAPDFMYMPVLMETDEITETIEHMNINYIGAELVFATEDAPIAQDSYIDMHHKAGRLLWGNAIEYDHKIPLAAGHCDNLSLLDDPEKGWGWLVEKGFQIVQSDWAAQCAAYMRNRFGY